jgi:predicted GTPase
MADVVVVTKVDSAPPADVERVVATARALRPSAPVVLAELEITVAQPELVRGRRVVVVEDGPTLTHGGLAVGAGTLAARRLGAAEVVDARPYATGAIADTFRAFPHLQGAIPAMGYSPQQVRDLEATLRRVPADCVIDATPVDLAHLLQPGKPLVDVRYEFKERGDELPGILEAFERRRLQAGPVAPAGGAAE